MIGRGEKTLLLAVLATQERILQEVSSVQHSSNWGPLGAQGLRERFETLRANLEGHYMNSARSATHHQLLDLAILELSGAARARWNLKEEDLEKRIKELSEENERLRARTRRKPKRRKA